MISRGAIPQSCWPRPAKPRTQPIPATRDARSLNRRWLTALRLLAAPVHAQVSGAVPGPADPGEHALDVGHFLGGQRAVIDIEDGPSRWAAPSVAGIARIAVARRTERQSRLSAPYVGSRTLRIASRCSASIRRRPRSKSRVPPLSALRDDTARPSAVFGPVDFAHGCQRRIASDCRARRSGVQPFAIAFS